MKLAAGKLPPGLLKELLDTIPSVDPSVVVGSALGEDAAVIDSGGKDLIIAKMDPITFAAADMGRYLLAVNGNDLATMGAEPRWLLVTALLPEEIDTNDVRELFAGVTHACREYGVSLVGGHTEVTVGLDRPILSGCLLGTVQRDAVVRTAGARVGDAVLLTTGVAIEGTAILASEHAGLLRERGVSETVIEKSSQWMIEPGISVLPACRALRDAVPVHSMHDPTEGGVFTALHEVAEAANVGLRVTLEKIEVLPQTRIITTALDIDPLGLLASGALLATVPATVVPEAIRALNDVGISAREIGEVVSAADGVTLVRDGRAEPLPVFNRDELARFLETR